MDPDGVNLTASLPFGITGRVRGGWFLSLARRTLSLTPDFPHR